MFEIDFNDAQQALAFLVPQLLRIETEVYQIKRPSFDITGLIPVNTDGDMWDAGVIFYSGDIAGKAEWLSSKGFDMPYADTTLSQHMQPTQLAGIGYEYSRGELERAARLGQNLTSSKARAATLVSDKFIYDVAISGSAEKGWKGLINDPGVPAAAAGVTFEAGTPEQILAIVNGALMAPTTATNGAFNANALLLPPTSITTLASRVIANTDTTILAFIRANNALTAQTGQPLNIRGMKELETAGSGGVKRLIAYDNTDEAMEFALPGPHTFLEPFRKSSMTWEVAGIMNLGGTNFRVPKAAAYRDGI